MHADRICKKTRSALRRAHKTSPLIFPAKQKWMEQRCLHPGAKNALLLFTRTACYLIFSRAGLRHSRILRPLNRPSAACGCRLSFILPGQTLLAPDGETAPYTRQNGLSNRTCSAAPSWRAHETALKFQRIQDMTSPWERPCPDISTLGMSTAFHAHSLLLYFELLICRWRISNRLSEYPFDCRKSYGENVSGIRVTVRKEMSLLAHATS